MENNTEAYEVGPDETEAIIRKEGEKWVLFTHDGKKKLGTFDSKKEAVKRLREVEYFKSHPKGSVVEGGFKAIARGSRNELPSPNKVFAAETNFDDIIKKNIIGQI